MAPGLQEQAPMARERSREMRSVRMDFTIERVGPGTRLMVRDDDGVIVAVGWTMAEVLGVLMDLLEALFDQPTPRSLEVRWGGDGRILLTSVHETWMPVLTRHDPMN